MKKENVKAINSQMKTLAKEVEGILDIGERANARAKYIELLFNISVSGALENGCSCGGNCGCGKDAIKEDIPKEVEEPMVEESEEESVEEVKQAVEEEVAEETEDSEVLDVTDIYNIVTDVEDPEERLQLAGYIAEYDECIDEYNSLDMLTSSGTKIYLAYCIKFYGLDAINDCVTKLTDNEFTNVFEYINDNNVEGFTQYVDQTFDEE